ncbi:MAG TPA: phosphate signaling complex protein PhoU [Anaerolineae bacterium]
MIKHTIRAFDADLQELASKIAEMGRLDDEQIALATDAFVKSDDTLARRVIIADDRIDALQREIEEKAISVIALRQPMGSDLREIVGALRISNELERVGDLAENIAKRVVLLTEEVKIAEAMLPLQRMVQLVREQLTSVLESYACRDVAAAMAVWRRDQEVDALNTALFREMLTYMMENPRNIAFCTHLLFCAKNIERIGDHTTNIAENVVYMVEGQPLAEERPKADLTSYVVLPLSA